MAKKIAKEYYLMHKDIPVCLMELTEGGTIVAQLSRQKSEIFIMN